ncbi:hypothetical protein P154DRAFT_606514 [Amniculicola lignicola CBS 123094]|uniref:Dopa 4,5-dioxygenase n=1 Tax=Amniculicola lignicola CBS 123094 TaxID=1392246 RepID=A0A6A5WDN1_9PLEO|nr:hypothetical protein P154DRAFT_606514 [Amniculicola lignicola CBS 123094]
MANVINTENSPYNLQISQYAFPLPLAGYKCLGPLSNEKHPDNTYKNPQTGVLSEAYQRFVSPVINDNGGRDPPGFDVHVYFNPQNVTEKEFAYQLWERIRREFPELRTYRIWETPCGPHAAGMFEVNLINPHQFGAFVSWIIINRGPLSALVHPNTDDEIRDHIQSYTLIGSPPPLDMGIFRLRAEGGSIS